MHFPKNVIISGNFATKGCSFCLARRDLSVSHGSSTENSDIADEIVHSYIKSKVNQGQKCLCRRCMASKKMGWSFNSNRKFSTSRRCLSVTVDNKKNYYHILGVTPQCSSTKIKQAYYRLTKVYHPDVNKTEAAVAKFHEISEAYEILSNPSLKHSYDSGRRGHSEGLHRGTVRPHPVNFKARGPHQKTKIHKYNYEEWMKEHYSSTFQKTAYTIKMKELEKQKIEEQRIERENIEKDMKGSAINEIGSLAFLSTLIATVVYLLMKK